MAGSDGRAPHKLPAGRRCEYTGAVQAHHPAARRKATFPSLRTLLLAGALGLAACSGGGSNGRATPVDPSGSAGGGASTPAPPTAGDANAAFAQLSAKYIERLFALDPNLATQSGEHTHDGRWPDVSVAGTAALRAFYAETKAQVDALSEAALDESNRTDRKILQNQLNYALFMIDEVKPLETNPLAYVGLIGDGLDPLLTREFAAVEQRMISLTSRLEGIPAIVAAARARLTRPPKIFTETAIAQMRGLIELTSKGLAESLAKAPGQRDAALAAAVKSTAALTELLAFFEKELLPRSDADFRIGRALFEKKLRYELGDDVDIDAVAADARALLTSTTEEMVATSVELWPTLFGKAPLPRRDTPAAKHALVKRVLDAVAKDRPTNATIVAEANKLLEETTTFVREHDLVRVPDEKCAVIEMPEYRRGVAVAYCESSGPFEAKPETYYAISPTPSDWSKARVDSFYKEYNRAMLVELTIHEAMPGHYLQAMHNNRFPSKLRALYGSGAFAEGWAVYGEWVMAKYGMGGPKVRLQRQKMVLRLCANAILDHDIHAGTLDEKQALALMQGDAFQEEGEAVGKWKRARLSSAQLTTYYYGFSEFMKLRATHETKPGFTERAYHDRVLSYGAPPMKLLREIMNAGQ
jgi:uncharacterized protein (DUF885 family)